MWIIPKSINLTQKFILGSYLCFHPMGSKYLLCLIFITQGSEQ